MNTGVHELPYKVGFWLKPFVFNFHSDLLNRSNIGFMYNINISTFVYTAA